MPGFANQEVKIVGGSAAIQHLREFARRVALGEAKVLITGESGVGKDIVARFIHAHSANASRPFVPVNCAGLSDTLLESELFGHCKGSFTGAYRDKVGRLQLAHRGTVFLDELGEMSLRMQALLLRFLENGEIQPVGGEHVATTVSVRVIGATNRDLAALVREGAFREDLLYRIKVVHLEVPPLRERSEDLPLLVSDIITRTGRAITFTDKAMAALRGYGWPGNVRELVNVIEQASWVAPHDRIDIDDLPPAIRNNIPPPGPAPEYIDKDGRRVADDLYEALSSGAVSFWEAVHKRFLMRDLTRRDVREVVSRGLTATNGNYRAVLPLLGIAADDYKKFLNFLATHDCAVDYKQFRGRGQVAPPPPHI